jgi:cullin 3
MIAKLKAECGYQFTSKLEGMFVDMNMSKGTMEQYRRTNFFTSSAVEVDIHMLTMGYWPLKETPPCILPRNMSAICDMFNKFYLDLNNGRKLTWMYGLGSVDLKATYAKTGKEFLMQVSLYQMVILNLFNESDTLSLDTIREASSIQQEVELRRHLLSLCTPKLRILRKLSKGKGVEDGDEFSFNEDFTSKFKRIKVPLISAKEIHIGAKANSNSVRKFGDDDDEDEGGVPAVVEEERRHMIEAALVRIMKSRKSFNHNELVAEVTRQLSNRFMPSPPAIKKRIESLIERDYLKRDDEEARVYHYLA